MMLATPKKSYIALAVAQALFSGSLLAQDFVGGGDFTLENSNQIYESIYGKYFSTNSLIPALGEDKIANNITGTVKNITAINLYGGYACNRLYGADQIPRHSSVGKARASKNTVYVVQSQFENITGGYSESLHYSLANDVVANENQVVIKDNSKVKNDVYGASVLTYSGASNQPERPIKIEALNNKISVEDSTVHNLFGATVNKHLAGMPGHGKNSSSIITNNNDIEAINSSIGSPDSSASIYGSYSAIAWLHRKSLISHNNDIVLSNNQNSYIDDLIGAFSYFMSIPQRISPESYLTDLQNNTIQVSSNKNLKVLSIIAGYSKEVFDLSTSCNSQSILRNNQITLKNSDLTTLDNTKPLTIIAGYGNVRTYLNSTNIQIIDNTINIQNTSITGHSENSIYGGYGVVSRDARLSSQNFNLVTVSQNKINIRDSTIQANIYGGFAKHSNEYNIIEKTIASNNSVTLKGNTTIDGDIFGGYSQAYFGDYRNHQSIADTDDPTHIREANNNTITIQGNVNLQNAKLYGSNLSNEWTQNNVLAIDGWKGNVDSIQNFNKITFKNIAWENNGIVTNIVGKDASSLANTEIELISINPETKVTAGDQMYIVKSDKALGTNIDSITVAQDFLSGVGVRGEGTLSVDDLGNILFSVGGTSPSGQADLTVTQQALAVGFLNHGSELIPEIFGYLNQSPIHGLKTFAIVQDSATSYDVNPELRLNGWNGMFGIASTWGNAVISAFIEVGDANYQLDHSQSNPQSGQGDFSYYGAGVASRFWFTDHQYMDVAGRVGTMKNDMQNAFQDAENNLYSHEVKDYNAHIAFGHNFELTENLAFYTQASYDYTHIDDESFMLGGNQFKIDSMDSHLLRMKVGINHWNQSVATRLGIAYEYEFNGKATATVDDLSIRPAELQGGTFVPEVGVTGYITDRFTLQGTAKFYIGQQDGLSGIIQATYLF